MNYGRIASAAVGGFTVYFVMGGVLFGVLPWLRYRIPEIPSGIPVAGRD
jgi:hypothetical protein